MKKHLETVDILRGIAALFVLIFHFTGPVMPKIAQPLIADNTRWGRFGVEIFFVISGFIIPYVLYKTAYALKDFGKFIGKRFIRICPPSYIIIVLTIIQYYFIERFGFSNNPWFSRLSISQVIHNFTYTIPFTNYRWITNIFWTLAIEFQFYILLGLIYTFMFKGFKEFLLCSLIIASLYYTPLIHSLTFFEYGSLFIMGGVTLLYYNKTISRAQFLSVLSLTGILCYFQVGWLQSTLGVLTALVIGFVNLKSSIGQFLGKISYSLYLTHILVGSSIEILFVKIFHPHSVGLSLLCSLIAMSIAIGFAYLFYRLFELYFIDLAGKLSVRKRDKIIEQPSL